MKKYVFLALILAATQANAGEFEVGELVENETPLKEYCDDIRRADDRCKVSNLDDFMLAGVLVEEKGDVGSFVNVIVKKDEFAKIEGKKVKARFDGMNPVGTIVEVM